MISLVIRPLRYFVARKELFEYPRVRNYLSLLGGIPVNRRQAIRTVNSFRSLVSLLRAEETGVIFPEGSFFRDRAGLGRSRLLQMILSLQGELASFLTRRVMEEIGRLSCLSPCSQRSFELRNG